MRHSEQTGLHRGMPRAVFFGAVCAGRTIFAACLSIYGLLLFLPYTGHCLCSTIPYYFLAFSVIHGGSRPICLQAPPGENCCTVAACSKLCPSACCWRRQTAAWGVFCLLRSRQVCLLEPVSSMPPCGRLCLPCPTSAIASCLICFCCIPWRILWHFCPAVAVHVLPLLPPCCVPPILLYVSGRRKAGFSTLCHLEVSSLLPPGASLEELILSAEFRLAPGERRVSAYLWRLLRRVFTVRHRAFRLLPRVLFICRCWLPGAHSAIRSCLMRLLGCCGGRLLTLRYIPLRVAWRQPAGGCVAHNLPLFMRYPR